MNVGKSVQCINVLVEQWLSEVGSLVGRTLLAVLLSIRYLDPRLRSLQRSNDPRPKYNP